MTLKDANGTLIHLGFALDTVFRYNLISVSRPETVDGARMTPITGNGPGNGR